MITRRDKENNIYAKLHQQALDSIQALSGNRWTDFNAHDPGVTILENALYALTEIQYHLQFPFETYLFADKKQPYTEFGLFPGEKIVAPSLVTPADYEKFICENTPGLKNCRISISDNGKYIIQAETSANREAIRKQIFELYHAHRNLCETLGEIVFETKISRNDDANAVSDNTPQFIQTIQKENLNHLLPKEYYSFQHHFPDTYGVNEKGAPAGSTPQRKIQILQLKAYLLIFDYLLANTLEQARNVADLLQFSDKIPSPYRLNFSIENMNKLIDNELFDKNSLHNAEFWSEQKSRLLDVLDMLYGEDTKTLVTGKTDLHEANKKRIELIRCFLKWNENRFRSFNQLNQDKNNIPEIAELAVAVFGRKAASDIYWIEHILLGDYPEENNHLTLVQYAYNQGNTDRGKLESFIRERLPAHLAVNFLWLDNQQISGFWKIHLLWREALLQQNEKEIIQYGTALHNFLIPNP
ncbi:MAG: hypothetical protein LBR97_05805 [Dysgonamonadaceae bacterium]|jgi:hypothetical protein|nr:hypothetical protein [Dysgonamonadaceae bacterium]